MMAWTILHNINDWEKYQKETAISLGIVGVPIAWGNGPKEFPCSVSTYMQTIQSNAPLKLVSAYVYVNDAEALIFANGVRTAKAVSESKIETSISTQQDNFNRWVSAYLLALVRELREIGAIKSIRFERSLAEALQLVDEIVTEKKDRESFSLDESSKGVIDRLYPKE